MVSDQLVSLRAVAGISSSELDGLAGLSAGYCGQIEAGKKPNVTLDTLSAIAGVLGCKVGYLAAGEGKAPPASTIVAAVARAQRKKKGKK